MSAFDVVERLFDSLYSRFIQCRLALFGFGMEKGIFLKEYVGRVGWMAIGFVVFNGFQSEFDHLSRYEELLEDGSLLAVLREDEELS